MPRSSAISMARTDSSSSVSPAYRPGAEAYTADIKVGCAERVRGKFLHRCGYRIPDEGKISGSTTRFDSGNDITGNDLQFTRCGSGRCWRTEITSDCTGGRRPLPGPDDILDMRLHRSVTGPVLQGAGLYGSYEKRIKKDARDRHEVMRAKASHGVAVQRLATSLHVATIGGTLVPYRARDLPGGVECTPS